MEKYLFFIISCSKSIEQNDLENLLFEYEYKEIEIKAFKIVDIIKRKDIFKGVKGLIDSLNNKNIYLCIIKLHAEKDNHGIKITIKIDKLNKSECKLKWSLNLKKGVKNIFIYSTEFKNDIPFYNKIIYLYFFNDKDKFKDKDVEDFVNKKLI